MIKENLKRGTLFYKIYLYYQLYFRYKLFYKKNNYSQFDEDIFIQNFFLQNNSGTFVDIGCFHPIRYNNTYLLYKMGWRGINIDLNPSCIDMFNIIRKDDENICSVIGGQNKDVNVYVEHLFSAANTIDKKIYDKDQKGNKLFKKVITSKMRRFKDIVKKKFDFLNIDVEGIDYEILKTIDLDFYKPKLVCIEILETEIENKKKIFEYFKKNNYSFCKNLRVSYFFKSNSFDSYNR